MLPSCYQNVTLVIKCMDYGAVTNFKYLYKNGFMMGMVNKKMNLIEFQCS